MDAWDAAKVTGWMGVGWVGVAGVIYAVQRALLFPAPRPPKGAQKPAELVWLPGPDGAQVPALYRAAPAGAPTVVFFHGNGEQLSDLAHVGPALAEAGVGLLAPEYPGYGWAEGTPSEAAIYAWAEASLAWLRAQGVLDPRTVLVGHSLGTGVAVELARRGHGARVALLAPYTSIPDVVRRMLPFLPVRLLARDRFDSLAKAPEVKVPVLILHGTKDPTVPFRLGRRLADALPDVRFEALEGEGHMIIEPEHFRRVARFAQGG